MSAAAPRPGADVQPAARATLDPRVPWTARLGYALGNGGDTFLLRAFELYVLFYYTQVLGLSGTVAGLAILLAMIVDAITDPLVGTYSDSLKARFGRRHTLMFASAMPTGALFYLLFDPPAALGGLALGVWLAVTAILLRVALTFFVIPWMAQLAELSPEPRERVTLAVLRNIFGALAGAVVLWAGKTFLVATPDYPLGQNNPDGYPRLGLALAIGAVLIILVSSAATYRRMRQVEGIEKVAPVRFALDSLARAWRDMLFRFPNFRCLFLGALFALSALSAFNAFALYLATYLWKIDSGQFSFWQLMFLVGGAISFVVGKPIVDRTRPARVFSLGIAVGVVAYVTPLVLKLLGVLGEDTATNLRVLLASNVIAGFFLGLVYITSAVLASETADEYETKTGVKGTAMLFGFITLSMKLASGLGKLVTGVAIDVIRLPAATAAASITAAQTTALGWAAFAGVAVLGLAGTWVFSGYRSPRRGGSELRS